MPNESIYNHSKIAIMEKELKDHIINSVMKDTQTFLLFAEIDQIHNEIGLLESGMNATGFTHEFFPEEFLDFYTALCSEVEVGLDNGIHGTAVLTFNNNFTQLIFEVQFRYIGLSFDELIKTRDNLKSKFFELNSEKEEQIRKDEIGVLIKLARKYGLECDSQFEKLFK